MKLSVKRLVEQIVEDELRDNERKRCAGVLFVCPSTERVLLVYRSGMSNEPHSWAMVGGEVEKGESIEEGLHREIREEIGEVPLDFKLEPSYVYKNDNHKNEGVSFEYHNYIAIVPNEFDPKLNWEHSAYGWFPFEKLPYEKLIHGVRLFINNSWQHIKDSLRQNMNEQSSTGAGGVVGYMANAWVSKKDKKKTHDFLWNSDEGNEEKPKTKSLK